MSYFSIRLYERLFDLDHAHTLIAFGLGPAASQRECHLLRLCSIPAEHNEALCKVLCHNLCVVIQSRHELEIDIEFFGSRSRVITLQINRKFTCEIRDRPIQSRRKPELYIRSINPTNTRSWVQGEKQFQR